MKTVNRILSIAVALCLVFSLGVTAMASGDDVAAAYAEYVHEFLLAELEVNSSMTIDQVEDEFMPLIEAGDYETFPADMLYGGMLESGVAMTFEEFAAQYDGAAAAAPAASGEAAAEGNVADTADMEAAEYSHLTNYTSRNDTGYIFIGSDVIGEEASVELNDTVTGVGYTAVYAHDGADVTVTGYLNMSDDTDGQYASDFSGQGAAFVAYTDSNIEIADAEILCSGFGRSAAIVSSTSTVTFRDSYVEALGKNPLTEIYDGYVNSANQDIMLSPPWVLGIQGGSRVVNMIGEVPTLNLINTTFVSGGWALISTDSGSDMVVNVVDSELDMLAESEGGMDSGWRIFGYEEDAYGSGYGSYYIGNPSQYYYGTTFDGVTYAAIVTGATTGHYASSNGSIDLYDAQGNFLETVEGAGNPTVINGVFGFMVHNSCSNGMWIEDGTIVNAEDAIVIYKAANSDWYFDNAELNSAKGVLFQMIDNDDDSRVGMVSMAEGFSTTYVESNVSGEMGFPGLTYDASEKSGGNTVTATYTNGDYVGDIFNGTGYYSQAGDDLYVTIGEGATLTGDIALTSTIKGIPYSAEAVEGIAYYGDDIEYCFLDADGNVCEEADAAYIQFLSYTINQYFLQGHVENKLYYNGTSTIDVVVSAGAEWTVEEESLITSLTVADGAVVKGEIVENADGSLTIVASDNEIAAGAYGSIAAIGGGENVGGGVTDDGTLDVEAAAGAIAVGGDKAASGEASAEPAASEEPADDTVTVGGYTFTVYTFDGVEYVKLADVESALAGESAAEGGDWAAYQEYLIEAAGGNAPDLDEFKSQVYSFSDWDSIPQDESPWDQLFSTLGISTWEQFQAGDRAESAESGSMVDASGEAEEAAAGGDTSEAAYQAYLIEYVDACPAVSDDQVLEFAALINAGDYVSFPVEMCFTDAYWGFTAMTLDEFVAAGGVYEIPAFDPTLTQDAEA